MATKMAATSLMVIYTLDENKNISSENNEKHRVSQMYVETKDDKYMPRRNIDSIYQLVCN